MHYGDGPCGRSVLDLLIISPIAFEVTSDPCLEVVHDTVVIRRDRIRTEAVGLADPRPAAPPDRSSGPVGPGHRGTVPSSRHGSGGTDRTRPGPLAVHRLRTVDRDGRR